VTERLPWAMAAITLTAAVVLTIVLIYPPNDTTTGDEISALRLRVADLETDLEAWSDEVRGWSVRIEELEADIDCLNSDELGILGEADQLADANLCERLGVD